MNEVTAAIAGAEASAVAAQAASGEPVQVGEFELQADDLVVETVPREVYAIASEPGCQVGVLKELTPELRAEGMVREAVHKINNLRRESGFAITDRIRLFVNVHGEPNVEETLRALVRLAGKVRHRQGSLVDRVKLFLNVYEKPNPLKIALLAGDKQFRDEVLATEVYYDAELPRGAPVAECVIGEHRVTIAVQLSWVSQLRATTTSGQVDEILCEQGLVPVVDRLRYLRQLAVDDADEPRMKVGSLRELARFLLSERWLPRPQIGVSPDGLAHAEWVLPGDDEDTSGSGILAMEFLDSGLIRFAAVSPRTPQGDSRRMRVNGTLPKTEAVQAVQPFTSTLCA